MASFWDGANVHYMHLNQCPAVSLLPSLSFSPLLLTSFGLFQVDICCFDKTGTLTSDNMVLEGLTGLPGRGQDLVGDVKQGGRGTVRVLAACQALIQVDGKFVGDPLEKASFTATGAVTAAFVLSLLPVFTLFGQQRKQVWKHPVLLAVWYC